jgi:two-component system catabolic regulation response regulator CreB
MNYGERIRVLYVEDNKDSFDMLQIMLAIAKIDLEPARSIADALAQAGSESFDLYLLDSGLPDGNGFSLCRTLRAVDPNVPILFYSGNAHKDEIKIAMDAGAHGYIIKPHSERLAETISQLVATRREQPFAIASLPVVMAAAA